jgi:hypothetical protein
MTKKSNNTIEFLDKQLAEVEKELEYHRQQVKEKESDATMLRRLREKAVLEQGPAEDGIKITAEIRRLLSLKPRTTDELISHLYLQLPAKDRLTDPAKRIRSTINLLIARRKIVQDENGINHLHSEGK